MGTLTQLIVCNTMIEADILIAKLSQNGIPAWCHLRHSHNTALQFITANTGYPVEVIDTHFDEATKILSAGFDEPKCGNCSGTKIVSIASKKIVPLFLLFFFMAPAEGLSGRKCMSCGNQWALNLRMPKIVKYGIIISLLIVYSPTINLIIYNLVTGTPIN